MIHGLHSIWEIYPFRWQGAAAMMVMNMVYWMKAAPRPLAGFLRFAEVESMDIPGTLGRNDGKHCRKPACLPWIFPKKMTCRAGFSVRKEANPSGIKKKREAPKKQRSKERKPNKSHPKISTWSANGLLTIWANPSQCPFTFSKVSCLQKSSDFNI